MALQAFITSPKIEYFLYFQNIHQQDDLAFVSFLLDHFGAVISNQYSKVAYQNPGIKRDFSSSVRVLMIFELLEGSKQESESELVKIYKKNKNNCKEKNGK